MSLPFLCSKNSVNSICKKCAHNVKSYGKVSMRKNCKEKLNERIVCHEALSAHDPAYNDLSKKTASTARLQDVQH